MNLPILAHAPGSPGYSLNWCDGAKQMVGTSLGPARVWFTIGQGILNEVYFPYIDKPQVRDLGFIISDDEGFWVELKTLASCKVQGVEPGAAATLITHQHERFTFTQRITTDPHRDVLLIEIKLIGDEKLRPYVLLSPHLNSTGFNNKAVVGHFGRRQVLWAEYEHAYALALAAVDEQQEDVLQQGSAGYAGASDLWQDFNQHGCQTHCYQAAYGHVALGAALPQQAVLALGFSASWEAASNLAITSLLTPFERMWERSRSEWKHWHLWESSKVALKKLKKPEAVLDLSVLPSDLLDEIKISAMVLRTHHDQTFRGALIASLSIPWGENIAWGESQEEHPGYHLVWPRDLVECAGALLALGNEGNAREILRYLIATQLENGSWYQNQWLGGRPYWTGLQLDEVAFPVLLAGLLADREALAGIEVKTMVRQALSFLATNGPASPQDRWEEDSGLNTFTLAVSIAAFIEGAQFLEPKDSEFILEFADYWNVQLDTWAAVYDTRLAQENKINGYYPRIIPTSYLQDSTALKRSMPIRNHKQDPNLDPTEQIGGDFLQLVRYGLRSADDPLIQNSLLLVDKMLKVELPQGPCWYRYNQDGYGEHADGSAYDGTGIGRLWPLLTGERGHYELAKGEDALPYLQTMLALADEGGMLPEQVWDTEDLPAQRLYLGRATRSAMPLAWAHAEFIKLACSIVKGSPIDRPPQVWERYQGQRPTVEFYYWTPQAPLHTLPVGKRLAFCLATEALISWHTDGKPAQPFKTQALNLGVHIARLPAFLANSRQVYFSLQGEGLDPRQYSITIA
ncbi:MAG TPA: glycoside hydrolase family 15 protein [Thiolinea sp.]|nr:glycoside hydrolase family 15 protein [Thiolinea sp.]